ncbi:MAG: hypothetical protein N2167_05435 [Flavobacteriales bacterium]|nr:hypothetical protein [Flavobacteriales bacterium]
MIFLSKVLAGVFLYLIYTYYYTDRSKADIYRFYDDSAALYQLLFIHPNEFFTNLIGLSSDFSSGGKYAHLMNNWQLPYDNPMYNDNRIVIRIHAVLRIISFGSFNTHTVFFSFFSFTGLFLITKTFYDFIRDWKTEIFIGTQLIPSVIFWTSGCLKESILMIGMGIFISSLFNDKNKQWYLRGIMIILGALIILLTKFYILAALLPAAIGYFISKKFKPGWQPMVFLLSTVFLGLTAAFSHYFFPKINLLEMLAFKQNNFVNLAVSEKAGSLITTTYLKPELSDIIIKTPEALLNTLLRPYPWESMGSIFKLIPMLENLFFLFFIGWIIWNHRKPAQLRFVLFCISFVLVLYIIVGLSTPVIGGMVRYKVPALPFLWITLLAFAKRSQSYQQKFALS